MIFIAALFVSLNALALSPEELRESVLKNFPLIEEALMKYESTSGAVTSAEGEFDHKLKFKSRNRIEEQYDNQYFETTLERNTGIRGAGLIAGHRQGAGLFPFYDGKYKTSSAGEIFAGISIPILRDSSTDEARTNLNVVKLERTQAEEEVKLKQNLYLHKALSLYYKWIAEERILRINKELLALAQKRADMLQKKFDRGDVEKVKLVDTGRTIEKRRAEIQKSEAKLLSLEAGLLLFVDDLSRMSKITDDGTVRLIKPDLPPALISDTLPQVKILSLELEKGKLKEKLYEQSKLPGLGVDVLGARELSGHAPYDPDSLQVGVRFDIPLENRKAKGKTVEQSYKLRALEKRLLYTERELLLNYKNTLSIIDLHHQRFETVSSEVEKTRTMARAEETRFQMGGSDLFVMNLRELDVSDAEIRRWNSWYEFHQAVLDAKLYQGKI